MANIHPAATYRTGASRLRLLEQKNRLLHKIRNGDTHINDDLLEMPTCKKVIELPFEIIARIFHHVLSSKVTEPRLCRPKHEYDEYALKSYERDAFGKYNGALWESRACKFFRLAAIPGVIQVVPGRVRLDPDDAHAQSAYLKRGYSDQDYSLPFNTKRVFNPSIWRSLQPPKIMSMLRMLDVQIKVGGYTRHPEYISRCRGYSRPNNVFVEEENEVLTANAVSFLGAVEDFFANLQSIRIWFERPASVRLDSDFIIDPYMIPSSTEDERLIESVQLIAAALCKTGIKHKYVSFYARADDEITVDTYQLQTGYLETEIRPPSAYRRKDGRRRQEVFKLGNKCPALTASQMEVLQRLSDELEE